jgi:hypothetical protein
MSYIQKIWNVLSHSGERGVASSNFWIYDAAENIYIS